MAETEAIGSKIGFLLNWRFILPAILIFVILFRVISSPKISSVDTAEIAKKKAVIGLASYKKGNFDAAVKNYKEAAKLNPRDAETKKILGLSYEAKGNLGKAMEAYEASLAKNASQSDVIYHLAIIHKSQGRPDQAVKELERAVGVDKQFIGARLILGDLYKEQGQIIKAKQQYVAILGLKPYGVDLNSVKKKLKEIDPQAIE